MYKCFADYHENAQRTEPTEEQKRIVKFLMHNLERLSMAIDENEELQIKSRTGYTEEQERAFNYGTSDQEILTRLHYKGSIRTFYRKIKRYLTELVIQYDIQGSTNTPHFIKADGTRTKRQILPPPIQGE